MKELLPVELKAKYTKLIYSNIADFMRNDIFGYIFDVLKPDKLYNDKNPIMEGIKNGKIKYFNSIFTAPSGFTATQINQLLELGAEYSKRDEGYKFELNKLPMNLQQVIAHFDILQQQKYDMIVKYLEELEANLPLIIEQMSYTEHVTTILDDAGNQFDKTMKQINVIPPDLSPESIANISKEYTNNLDYFIKNWSEKTISELREEIKDMTLQGKRLDLVEELIEKKYNISKNKAHFLAENETSILIAKYRQYRFQSEGINSYKWRTRGDGKVRQWHKELNGQIFTWDTPPIIDDKTGQKGHPGETYNCRCLSICVVTQQFWDKAHKK